MLRRLYDWCVDAAGKPHAAWVLGAISFAESSFFPVPPDIMLIPMSLARPERAWYFATICTITSVAGGRGPNEATDRWRISTRKTRCR